MKKYFHLYLICFICVFFLLSSCTKHVITTPDNAPGRPTVYEDVKTSGRLQGVGIESQDIVSMTDKMMRDMLSNQIMVNRGNPRRVIIDGEYFRNEGSQRINKKLIADRLRIELNRAAQGRLLFVARHAIEMVEKERELKQEGIVDQGTKPMSMSTAGADFRLVGNIKDINQIDPNSGTKSRYVQITFEMVDLDKGYIVWSGIYEFKKSAQDDIVYR